MVALWDVLRGTDEAVKRDLVEEIRSAVARNEFEAIVLHRGDTFARIFEAPLTGAYEPAGLALPRGWRLTPRGILQGNPQIFVAVTSAR